MKQQFTHLHTHSHYSLLNALPKIKDLIAAARKNKMKTLALTDAGNLYGAIEFYQSCKRSEIKPIIGVDFYVAARSRNDKEAGIDNKRSRLVLLAENEAGYKNLIKLVTLSHIEGFYYKPRIDHDLMRGYSDGLIAIIPSFSGETSLAIKNDDASLSTRLLAFYKSVYGDDNYFLEVTHHPEIEGHENIMKKVVAIAKKTNTPLVACHDVYYINPEDRTARETLMQIQGGMIDRGGFDDEEDDFSFISQETAETYFKDLPDALLNNARIADRCNLKITMKWTFPEYVIESGLSPDEELTHLALEGVGWRGLSYSGEVKKRLQYELDIIKMKKYALYFLVVGDLMLEARRRKILTTIRGSVAGSLTTYVLGITNVNPLDYDIPFERFLNPERPSAPDIDMDFADNRRDEIIQYARDKYGADKVAQIGTFGTMLARGVVRDVARALGYPYALGDRIAKLIPIGSQGFPMTIDRALETTPELRELYSKEVDVRTVIDLGKKIEGNARHISVHAAGVVIAPKPLTEYVPIQYDPKTAVGEEGKLITQYDMHGVGEDGIGLLKFDFLGIKNLSILADSVDRAKERHGVSIDIENIPLDNEKTFEMLSRGETMGLFQLNGSGATRYLKELKPTRIQDINAMIALYRPGPMEIIPEYVKRKHNPALVRFLDPRMKEYLEDSFGLIVYQEDVMLSAIKLAGYSWLEADKFRKAMGKKIPKEMADQKEKLIRGIVKNGQTQAFAEKLWKLFEPFQSYGFNKAHAASYGKVAYQTAYMKANYPIEYMAALLTADAGNVDKIAETIAECNRMKIPVLPPDINESFGDFTIVKGKDKECIRFGLYSIKNFGEGIADVIINERKDNGPYASLTDFLERVHNKNLNRKSLESLIKCGALDQFEERGVMLENIEILLAYNKEVGGSQSSAQESLFGGLADSGDAIGLTLSKSSSSTKNDWLVWEKELLGLYISGHPLDKFKDVFKQSNTSIQRIHENLKEGMAAVAAGIIEDIRPVNTKRGDRMAFLKIADFTGSVEVVLFPKVFAEYRHVLTTEMCVSVRGRVSNRNGETSVIGETVRKLKATKVAKTTSRS